MKTLRLRLGDRKLVLRGRRDGETLTAAVRWEEDETARSVRVAVEGEPPVVVLRDPEGRRLEAALLRTAEGVWISWAGQSWCLGPDVPQAGGGAADQGDEVRAPISGRVVDVRVGDAQIVEKGQLLGLLEAMKTEVPLVAPRAGRIHRIAVQPGDRVDLGATLFELAPEEDTP